MHFLRKQESPDGKVYVSSIAALKPGFEFLIQCNSDQDADTLISELVSGHVTFPTVNIAGYTEVTNTIPRIVGFPRIFRRI